MSGQDDRPEASRGSEGERPPDPRDPLGEHEKEALLQALARGLEEALPGIQVLDRGLVLDEGLLVDVAAVDASGSLVVALLADPDPDRASLAALDLVAWLGEHAAVLRRHLASPSLRPEQPVRVLVVLTEAVDRLRQRLGCLASAGVELLGLRTVQSSMGDHLYLSRLGEPLALLGEGGDMAEAFVGRLPADLRALARFAVERIGRLDDELIALPGQDCISWRFRGASLLRLERSGDRLRATLGEGHDDVHLLRRQDDVEELLEGALERLVPLFTLRPQARPQQAHSDAPLPREPLPTSFPTLDEPLLSAEEIDAFRD